MRVARAPRVPGHHRSCCWMGAFVSILTAARAADVPQPRLGEICRNISFSRTIGLRHLAALRPSTASDMKAIVL
eukprot:1200809-Prymnesium_polylepis.1